MAGADPSNPQELVSLSLAAAHALARLVPLHVAESSDGVGSLDLVAVAICALVPVYRRDGAGRLQRISADELAARQFAGAAALLITRADAEIAAEKLVAEYVGTKPFAPAPRAEARRKRL